MARPFKKLRDLMYQNDVTQADLAVKFGVNVSSISRRMCNREEWRLEEMWTIMKMFDIPPEKLHEIFPFRGINEPNVMRPSGRRIKVSKRPLFYEY